MGSSLGHMAYCRFRSIGYHRNTLHLVRADFLQTTITANRFARTPQTEPPIHHRGEKAWRPRAAIQASLQLGTGTGAIAFPEAPSSLKIQSKLPIYTFRFSSIVTIRLSVSSRCNHQATIIPAHAKLSYISYSKLLNRGMRMWKYGSSSQISTSPSPLG